jgi:hypothetical protein
VSIEPPVEMKKLSFAKPHLNQNPKHALAKAQVPIKLVNEEKKLNVYDELLKSELGDGEFPQGELKSLKLAQMSSQLD